MAKNQVEIEYLAKDNVSKVLDKIEKKNKKTGREIQKGSKKTEASFNGVTNSIGKLGLAGTLSLAALATAVGAFTISSIKNFLEYERAYNQMTLLVGDGTDDLIKRLRAASSGMISTLDLVKSANRSLALGLSQAQLPELLEAATARAKIMGITATQAFNDIATGVGRQSRMILDNLGIILDLEKAYKSYSREIGKTVEELTDFERKAAISNSIIEETSAVVLQQALQTDDLLTSIERLKAGLTDFTVSALSGMKELTNEIEALTASYSNVIDLSKTPAFQELPKNIEDVDNLRFAFEGVRDRILLLGDPEVISRLVLTRDTIGEMNSALQNALQTSRSLETSLLSFASEPAIDELKTKLEIAKVNEDIARLTEESAKAFENFGRGDLVRANEIEIQRLERQKEALAVENEFFEATRKRLNLQGKLEIAERTGGVELTREDLARPEAESLESKFSNTLQSFIDAEESTAKIRDSIVEVEQKFLDIGNSIDTNTLKMKLLDSTIRNSIVNPDLVDTETTTIFDINQESLESFRNELDAGLPAEKENMDERIEKARELGDELERSVEALIQINQLVTQPENVNI